MYSLELLAFLQSIGARRFLYPLTQTVPALSAGGTAVMTRTVQNDADFLCMSFTTIFPTVNAAADDGVCRLQAKLSDGGSQLTLCDDFLDLSTIATPGRRRSAGVAGDPSLGLAIPGFPWLHLYPANGEIRVELKNSADTAARVDMTFEGFKVPPSMRQKVIALLNPMNEAMPS